MSWVDILNNSLSGKIVAASAVNLERRIRAQGIPLTADAYFFSQFSTATSP
jgi:hypothetical protein